MTSWLADFNAALDARDAREKSQKAYIDAYTKLADRTATLSTAPTTSPPPASPLPRGTSASIPSKTRSPEPSEDALTRLRVDLGATQRSRAELQGKVKSLSEELTELKTKSTRDTQQISLLTREKTSLERRLKDRDEELRGKAKLIGNVHDEMAMLDLERNMAEDKAKKLTRENKELVDRWMARMGKEADDMNERSKWS